MTIAVVSDEGTVTITDAALSQIVVQAAEALVGVRVRRRRQLEIAIADTGTRVQLELEVPYGRVLPDVARDVQERVASALGTMCGVNVTAVDVAIEELS
jgi:uncharacterized alkaline shock family protein YloU